MYCKVNSIEDTNICVFSLYYLKNIVYVTFDKPYWRCMYEKYCKVNSIEATKIMFSLYYLKIIVYVYECLYEANGMCC